MGLDKWDHRSLVLWATDCAEHVLPYFEKKCLKDDRPRNAVEAGRAWACGEITMSEAHAAARAADRAAARPAARAAARAAATAHVAAHAAHAATYAVTAATAATDAAASTDSADSAGAAAAAKERDWHYRRLPQHLRPVAFPARGNN